MSTIKIGDKVVQTTDRSGRIRGGIDNRSRLDRNPNRFKSDTQIVQEQAQKIKNINEQFKNIDDNRSKFLALSTPKAILADAQNRRILNRRRAQILEDLKAGKNVDRSEFTGREPKPGTKNSLLTALGIGTVTTGKPKLRTGLSSSEYADFMRQAYQANPGMMESLFPFASGKTLRSVSRLLPGIGTLQNLASAAKTKTTNLLDRAFPGLINRSGIATTNQAQPTLAELAENAYRFGSFRSAPTNIDDIRRDNEFKRLKRSLPAIKLFSGFPGTQQDFGVGTEMISSDPNITSLFQLPIRKATFGFDPNVINQIIEQSKTPPDIDVSMEGIAPVLNTSNTLNQTGSVLTGLTGDSSIAQQKEFFERAIRGNVAGVPDRIGEIYQNLLDSGALSSSEALQYGSFVRNLPPPSNTYGLNSNIKPGIEGINLQGNFPGVI